MKYVATVLTVLFISFPTHVTVASEDCNYTWVLINTDGSKATPDQHAEK